ncbi:hypothetical protein GP486_002510 [Trichoglossum hirsutum]|uniref:Uncharacterized protein n=1 Tax=Trichoglossum hirsutum TaxID=265104 RepID=A0A9P8RRN0_9PEZI|nr:hypothetical protein GP486_002510 [Trichoglossum hirsutum]
MCALRSVAVQGKSVVTTYDPLVFEVFIKFARPLKIRIWCSPLTRLRLLTAKDILRDLAAWKEPDLDAVRRPESGEDTATNSIEILAVGVCAIFVLDAAAGLLRGALSGFLIPGLFGVLRYATFSRGVESHQVLGLFVYAFKDVDFTVLGPKRWAECPTVGGISYFRVGFESVGMEAVRKVKGENLTRQAKLHRYLQAYARYPQ